VIDPFTFTRTPALFFGAGVFNNLVPVVSRLGRRVLIVTGASSFESSGKLDALKKSLAERSVESFHVSVSGEPSPEIVDSAVAQFRDAEIDVVCSIGGGSVIDAGKAVSAMYLQDSPVFEFLEGVGSGRVHDGRKIPFIAVPTTAGTGSEATKNAVLSRTGQDGFKKSLRHDNFVPNAVIIDPELALSCPPAVTAASGMDAFTQLLESYVSIKSSPLTDALALDGMKYVAACLVPACGSGAGDVSARAGMAYGAYLSGVTLANAGLGVVHGLASPIGGLFDIPHGVVCGTLVSAATRITIESLKKMGKEERPALEKYARAGALFAGEEAGDTDSLCGLIVEKLEEWMALLEMPRLGEFGIGRGDVEKILDGTGSKNNPGALQRDDVANCLLLRSEIPDTG